MSRFMGSGGLAIVATLVTSAAARFPAPGDACTLLTKEDAATAWAKPPRGPRQPAR
jgi:hypothetical protein